MLTIIDSSQDKTGKITGGTKATGLMGSTSRGSGGIYNYGTLILEGGSVRSNSNSGKNVGGGIYNAGTLYIKGGTITGNTLSGSSIYGAGVYNAEGATMIISGDPKIYGNSASYQGNTITSNVYLNGITMGVSDRLSDDAEIYVTKQDGFDVITNGLKGKGSASNFKCDSNTFAVTLNENGEAQFRSDATVTFSADEGCTLIAYTDETEGEGGAIYTSDDADSDAISVSIGTRLRVTAKVKPGYILKTEIEESYTVTDDITISVQTEKAQYTVTASATEGKASEPEKSKDNPVPYGTEITLTAGDAAGGYEFIGWYQRNGKQISAEKAYTFPVYSNVEYVATYQKKNVGTVTFVINDRKAKTLTQNSISQADYPASSEITPCDGFVFDGWDKTVEEVNAVLAEGNNITVTAGFKAKEQNITVTVYNGESETPTELHFTENQWITVTADDVADKNFACWRLDGELLSYNKKVSFRTDQDCTIKAFYSVETVEAVGIAFIKTANYNQDTKKLVFVARLEVPTGAVIKQSGLVSSPAASYDPEGGVELSLDNAVYKKNSSKSVGTGGPVNYTWTKSSVELNDVWYARPYVIYTYDDENVTIYGEMVTVRAGYDYDRSEKATAVIKSSSYDASTGKAKFVAYITVPDGGKIVKAGVVASPAQGEGAYDPSAGLLTLDNAMYKKVSAKAVGTGEPLNYTWTKSSVAAGDKWYIRAYVIYTIDGVERSVYGDLVTYTAAS